ncbi:PAQR family membrane homeostasis protein TrhA [Actinobaculum suis]|uniref:PAQR family membrane homeostasis protein TrhA n=1 Tax=Actinobaculum suis TaxID=1657 RepID=UPI000808686B|nr:hemolysin III family protein [Actinobaculum suis]OCA93089.1 hemolysin [Actinobaculum suis]OCA93520.1 hemolysin [Actinobaculum suis]
MNTNTRPSQHTAPLTRYRERKKQLANLPKPKLRGWQHAIMAPAAIAVGIVQICLADGAGQKVACAIFMACAVILFGHSALYHLGNWSPRVHRVLRRMDHSNIFLLIAGTYTPLTIGLMSPAHARLCLTIVWTGAILGILISHFWPSAPRWVYVPLYIALGWVAVWFFPEMVRNGSTATIWLILLGGIAYTVGAMAYAFRWPNPCPRYWGFHEFFHLGTVIGYTLHTIAVFFVIL